MPGLPDGAFYRPTVIADCAQDSEIVQQRGLRAGPGGAAVRHRRGGLEKANDTNYGLAARIWTSDVSSAMGAARTLNFGHVQVNDHLMVTSEMPHGGFKQSGYGKDMSSYSFEEYTQVKHVMLELTGERREGLALHGLRRQAGGVGASHARNGPRTECPRARLTTVLTTVR